MKLIDAEICNYRSIESETISFEPNCRILLGINESGKTNILKALALLGDEKPVRKLDLRQASTDEPEPEESFIKFRFAFSTKEINDVYDKISDKFLSKDNILPLAKEGGKVLTLHDICFKKMNTIQYKVDILQSVKSYQYFNSYLMIRDGWQKIDHDAYAEDIEIRIQGEICLLSEYDFIFLPDIENKEDIPDGILHKVNYKNLLLYIFQETRNLAREKIPSVIFWSFKTDDILPADVNIQEFCSDPDSCKSLKHMFQLAGFTDVEESINAKIDSGGAHFKNMLKKVSNLTTEHFRKVWKDYKNLEFVLSRNGDSIEITVKEDTKEAAEFQISQRSDGFKRFLSFLLLISARVKSGDLNNILLLADEPDVSLHPSGIKHLRDELIKISNAGNNTVICSTHSIFMIDYLCADRHIALQKTNDITNIYEGNSALLEEEVFFNALNTSIFELVKPLNILLEGWRDKQLLETALRKPGLSDELKKLKKLGILFSTGVKHILYHSEQLQSMQRQFLIMSDADSIAIEKRKLYAKNPNMDINDWQTFFDLGADESMKTAEDFIKNAHYESAIKRTLKNEGITEEFEDYLSKPRLDVFDNWAKTTLKINRKEDREALKNKLKENIYFDLQPRNIEDSFYVVLNNFYKKLLEKESS